MDSLDNRKADKTELNSLGGDVASLASDLEQERQERIAADNALGGRIDSTNDSIADIREGNIDRDFRISALERDLTKEINDRVDADNALIGTPDDRDEDNTIYGAKKYADKVAATALSSAKAYTDVKDSSVRDYVDETKADLERQITAKADKAYVNSVKDEINASVDSKIATERLRAVAVEESLENAIIQENLRAIDKERAISSALNHTSNIVKALTDWDGDDRIDYTDEGNGIVDVMHRELHDIETTISALTQIGEGIITTNPHEVGFGTYNLSHTGIDDSEKTMFSIGIGSSGLNRKNAIDIRRNGDVYLLIEGEMMCINTLIAMLAHETY